MTIYSYDKVINLLDSYGMKDIYHGYRLKYMRTFQPELLDKILQETSFLPTASLTERLYCIANSILARPQCKICGKNVTFYRGAYHTYCSQRCSMLDMKSLLGVDNPSQLEQVKQKKKELALTKYGVDNVSKAQEVIEKISIKRLAYWETVYQNKQFTVDNLTREKYSRRCHQYAVTQYERHKHILDPENKRGKNWHVDHIYSITDGFINDVPINIISDISNLRLISATDNYKKNKSSYKSLEELYEDYQSFYQALPSSSMPSPEVK